MFLLKRPLSNQPKPAAICERKYMCRVALHSALVDFHLLGATEESAIGESFVPLRIFEVIGVSVEK